ncbi:MAG: ORF6N domain-containing protein [Flavobacteriales bacterium]|nr:ORF6N domain-containing protein [Flavobacteriales bacterium]
MEKTSILHIQEKLIDINQQKVLIDRDVAHLFGVETKRINEAVKNNIDKFPSDYIIVLSESEWNNLRSKFSTANYSKTRVPPKAFTEKGLYMLATILKSKQATQATFLIIETFAKLRALQQMVTSISSATEEKKNSLLKKSGELMAELMDESLQTLESETTIELNFAVLKLKHTTKRKKENEIEKQA